MKLAILLPNWVGDACMATPTLRAIRHGLPSIDELCWIGRPGPMAVLEGLPWCDSRILYKPRSKSTAVLSRRRLVRELRSRAFDTIVLLPNSIGTGLIAYLSGIRKRIGYAADGRSLLLTDALPRSRKDRNRSCIESYLGLAEYLGCDASDRRMEVSLTDADIDAADKLWQQFGFDKRRPTVMFNTSSATAPARMWPIAPTIRAASTLASQHAIQVIIHCGPADRERADAVAHGAAHPLVRSMGLCADLPLGLSKGVMAMSDVVVSTDSGPRHIAAALNRPVIGLYGPTDPNKNKTFNIPETILTTQLACQPCGKTHCPLKHTQCMHGLNHRMVIDAILQRLSSAGGSDAIGQASRIPRTAA